MLTNQERAAITAALRLWQQCRAAIDEQPLAVEELEALRQRLERDNSVALLDEVQATEANERYVLFDPDSGELATKLVYDSYADAQEDADQFDDVLILKLLIPRPHTV